MCRKKVWNYCQIDRDAAMQIVDVWRIRFYVFTVVIKITDYGEERLYDR